MCLAFAVAVGLAFCRCSVALRLPLLCGIAFAIATVISSFGTGNLPQSNGIATSIETTFGFEPWIVGSVLGILLALVILGGIQRIAAFTARVVPFMAVVYLIGALSEPPAQPPSSPGSLVQFSQAGHQTL